MIYERNKWYTVGSSDPSPQIHGSIYFITKSGEKYAGTYLAYSQFSSLQGKVFEDFEVEKWIIREDWKIEKGTSTIESIYYNDVKILIELKSNLSHYWQASIIEVNSNEICKEPTREKALTAIKKLIEKKNP